MKIDLIRKALLGECDEHELGQVKKFLNSWEGAQFISEHFKRHNIKKEDILNQSEEQQLLGNIHYRIGIEELINEIGKESEQRHQKIYRDRASYPGYVVLDKRKHNRQRITFLTVVSFFVLLVSSYLLYIYYWNDSSSAANNIVWIEKSTDRGQQLTIRLMDGTLVILNSNSRIRYPELFNDSVRAVTIQGEAYFEVSHNESQPFVVDAGLLRSKVLGTSFNIVNNPLKNFSSRSLVTGKVEVTKKANHEKMILIPGEAALVNEAKGFEKLQFDLDKTIAWKDKIIYFSGENFPEVFDYLENWYGVNIELVNTHSRPVAWKLNAKFENESLKNVLNALSESHGFTYKMEGKNVTVKF